MSQKNKMVKVRHASLEMPDPEVMAKKKQDVLSKARNKFISISDILKPKHFETEEHKKSKTQSTLDYFFKPCPSKEKHHRIITNTNAKTNSKSFQKQNSVDSYPIKIEITSEDDDVSAINRLRPATVCVDRVSEARQTDALALERPRKKLSFREPEIMSNSLKPNVFSEMKRSTSFTIGILHKTPSVDDFDLESQAMRVVRTVGQAFEVCHKLSINAPENDNLDQDEQDTLTQDLLSDNFSDIISEKPKKDLISEGTSDKLSLPPDDNSFKDSYSENNKNMRPSQLDMLPPPPNTNTRKSPLITAETYASPHSDVLTSGSGGSGSGSLPPPGSALSAHHELQLMREQLEQQNQQTQAAVAQLQLTREQLAAEQSARMEAQARTHQLLIQNRELLDHIAALVAHLQGGEKSGQQQTPPHMTMPQQQQMGQADNNYNMNDHISETASLESSPILQSLGLNPQGLIENRAVTSCLPPSPHRSSLPPGSTVFNFSYPPPIETYDSQLLQRLQALSGYPPPASIASPYCYNYNNQNLAFLYNQPMLNNNYTLQPPPKKMPSVSPLAMRHSFTGPTSNATEQRISPGRNSEPKQTLLPPSHQQQYQSQQNLAQYQNCKSGGEHLQVQQQSRQGSIQPPERREGQFIKPLAQMGTLTTTDTEGRVRVIVPVPSNSNEDVGNLLANLRITDDLRPLNGPPITRSTSEKVPNRSELMSQVQRTAWARHTTK